MKNFKELYQTESTNKANINDIKKKLFDDFLKIECQGEMPDFFTIVYKHVEELFEKKVPSVGVGYCVQKTWRIKVQIEVEYEFKL